MDLVTKTAEVEYNILILQEKESLLLLTRKGLKDAGMALAEVNATFLI